MKILITGVTGLIGRQLAIKLIHNGHQIVGISRKKQFLTTPSEIQFLTWDALADSHFPHQALKGIDVVIHLAGEPVATKRWTEKIRKNILDSRVLGTRQIVEALGKWPEDERPQIFIAGSAIGYYGDCSENVITEKSLPGNDFLSDVVVQWENEINKIEKNKIRTVILRTGIVLSSLGGALSKMPPVVIGQGRNYMSWIHIDDWVQFAIEAIGSSDIKGVYHLTAPEPVQQKQFIKELCKSKNIPFSLWSPQFLVALGLGEMSKVLLSSQNIVPEKILKTQFKFKFSSLSQALKDIYK